MCTREGEKDVLDSYLKEEKNNWEKLANTLKQTPATSTFTPSVVAITATGTTTITAARITQVKVQPLGLRMLILL